MVYAMTNGGVANLGADDDLPEPDLVIYLSLDPTVAVNRCNYGAELYENPHTQASIKANFDELFEKTKRCFKIDASDDATNIAVAIRDKVLELRNGNLEPLGRLKTTRV